VNSLILLPVNSKLNLSPVPLHVKQALKRGGGGNIAVTILGSGSKREWVLSATTRPLYPRERDTLPIVYRTRII